MDPRHRGWVLRGFLLLMALSTLNALRLILTRWPEVAAAFPGGGALLRPMSIVLACGLLASYGGLWQWRRWGVGLALLASALTIGADIAWQGPRLHLLAAVISSGVLLALLWWNRARFLRTTPAR